MGPFWRNKVGQTLNLSINVNTKLCLSNSIFKKILFRKIKTIFVVLKWFVKSEFSHFCHLCIPPLKKKKITISFKAFGQKSLILHNWTMLKIKVRKNIYLFLQNLNTNLKYKFSLAERPLSNTQYLPLGARLYSACWVTELKVDYILVWSQSNLLFSIRQIFYQKMQFCRLTCDTNLENFLKGFRFIFSTNLIFRKICENSACYRVSHGKVSFRDLELGGVHKLRLQEEGGR